MTEQGTECRPPLAGRPFVNPRIVEDLSDWFSDRGDQVVAINLTESNKSNRYFGEIEVVADSCEPPFVFVDHGKDAGGRWRGEFGYQYVGRTASGIHVLLTRDCGGGTGRFTHLMLVRIEKDPGYSCDYEKHLVRADNRRLLIRKLGEIGLGDRWEGELRVEGDSIFVGKDHGFFAGPDRPKAYESYDPKDEVYRIEAGKAER